MRVGSLVIKYFKRDIFIMFVLLIMSFYLTQMGLVVVRGVDQLTYLTRLFSVSGLDKQIIYTFEGEGLNVTEEEATKIEAVEGVLKAEVGRRYEGLLNDQSGLELLSYDLDALEDLRFPLSEGRYPERGESNHILLPPDYREIYRVGETIHFWMQNFGMYLEDEDPIPVTVVVSGFLQDDLTFSFGHSSSAAGIAELFSRQPNTGIVYSLVDDTGHPVKYKMARMIFVTPEQGVNLDDLKEDIIPVVRSKSFVHTGPEMVENYWISNTRVVRDYSVTAISSFFLAFSTLLAGTYFSLIYRQKEMAVHYMAGATWEECIVAVLIPKIAAIFLGFLYGLNQYGKSVLEGLPISYGIYAQARFSYVLIVFAIILGLFFFGVFPFYIMTLKKSPMELFRKD